MFSVKRRRFEYPQGIKSWRQASNGDQVCLIGNTISSLSKTEDHAENLRR